MTEHVLVEFRQPNHLVVLGHPDPNGFCGAIARRYSETIREIGHEATLRDLYAQNFDPRLTAAERPGSSEFLVADDVAAELDELRSADVIALVYPIWFGLPPAIIKGYIDRVLGAGFSASAIKEGRPNPLLAGKRLVLLTSSASTLPWLEEKGQWQALRQAFEGYLQSIFSLRDGGHTHFDAIVPGLNPRLLEECLELTAERARVVSAEVLSDKRAAQSKVIRERRPS